MSRTEERFCGTAGNAVAVVVKKVRTIDALGLVEEMASKYHHSKTVVLTSDSLGDSRSARWVESGTKSTWTG